VHAAEFILELDLPEYRRRPRQPISGVTIPRACDEKVAKPVQYVGIPWTLEKCATTAVMWMTRRYAGNGFEEYVRDLSAALDDAGDRAIQAEQGAMSGSLHLGRTIFRSG
jgi:hypothetical protein